MSHAGIKNMAQLASLAGVDATTVGRWCRGEKEPTIDGLRAVAPHLGVDLLDLMVRAGLLTKLERGATGTSPPPGPPMPPTIRRIIARWLDPKQTAEDKERYMRTLDRATELFDEATPPSREPDTGAGRSRPRKRR